MRILMQRIMRIEDADGPSRFGINPGDEPRLPIAPQGHEPTRRGKKADIDSFEAWDEHGSPPSPRELAQVHRPLREALRHAPRGAHPRGDRARAAPRDPTPARSCSSSSGFIDVCTAVLNALNADGARAFWQKSLHDCIDEPLIVCLLMAGFLFGRSPEGLYRRTPQAWALVTRNAGDLSVEPGPEPRLLWLHVRDLPPVCRVSALLHMWEGERSVRRSSWISTLAWTPTISLLAKGSADLLIRWEDAKT